MTRILVPPGIGDGYWVLVKLRGFMERLRIPTASIHVQDAGPRRSHGMWERVPFVTWGGYAQVPTRPANRIAFQRAYRTAAFPVQRRVCGFDYLISFNGTLDGGRTLDRAMPGQTNWFEPLTKMEVTEDYAQQFRTLHGEYVVAAFWDHGFYRKWLAVYPEQKIVETLRLLADAGRTVVVMGAPWDKGTLTERISSADERFVNLVGETDFDQLTGLLSGASGVFGFPAGNTILGPRFGAPTVMLWTDHFHRTFWREACPPDPALYQPLDAAVVTPAQAANALLAMGGVRT